ncbi:MAG TPA: hypothetical protein PLV51_05870 [Lentimicrobium sp.]|jgi:hypothetical protein|nr:hypothetical protein [Lentimicrobium sp.]
MLRKLSKSGIYLQLTLTILMLGLFVVTPPLDLKTLTVAGNIAPLAEIIRHILPGNQIAQTIIAALLAFGLFLIFNLILINQDIVPRQSMIVAFIGSVFILFSGSSGHLILLLCTIYLLLFSLYNILKIYGEQYPYILVLNASVAISAASMIIPPAIAFFPFIWMGFFTLRIGTWREWSISLLGLMLPYLYLLFWFFWNNNLVEALHNYSNFFSSLSPGFINPSLTELVTYIILGLLLLLSLFSFLGDTGEKIISLRKKMWIIAQFLLAGLLFLFLSGPGWPSMLPVIALPLSVMFAFLVLKSKKSWFYDLLLGIFFLLVILLRINI